MRELVPEDPQPGRGVGRVGPAPHDAIPDGVRQRAGVVRRAGGALVGEEAHVGEVAAEGPLERRALAVGEGAPL